MKKCLILLASWLGLMCGGMTVRAAEVDTDQTEVKEIPFLIETLEDDPAANEPDYLMFINRAENYTTIFTTDETGAYTIPVIKFVNSTGKYNRTPLGSFHVYQKYSTWKLMNGNVYTQNAVRFNKGVMSHSECYSAERKDMLSWEQFNKLGEQASSGCVRTMAADSQWIYEHCKIGTPVIVSDTIEYDGVTYADPWEIPHTVTIPADSPYKGWDPTDTDLDNPWQDLRPVLYIAFNTAGIKTIELPVGATEKDLRMSFELAKAEGVPYCPETTEFGLTMPYAIEIYGVYDLNTPGEYTLYVRGFDLETTLRTDATYTLRVK